MFPVEIVEKILYHADGRTLIRSRKVCTTWRAVVDRLTEKSNVWCRVCSEELSMEDINELLKQLYPAARPDSMWDDPMIDWYTVYCTHHVWSMAGRCKKEGHSKPRTIVTADDIKSLVTCVSLTGTCVLSGHENGNVSVWSQDGVLLATITSHQSRVNHLEPLSFFHELPDGLWDVDHEYIISTSEDSTFHITAVCPIGYRTDRSVTNSRHSAPTVMARTCGNHLGVLSMDGHFSMWFMEKPEEVFAPPSLQEGDYVDLNEVITSPSTFDFFLFYVDSIKILYTPSLLSKHGRTAILLWNDEAQDNNDDDAMDDEYVGAAWWTPRVNRNPVLLDKEGSFFHSFFPDNWNGRLTFCWRNELFVWVGEGNRTKVSCDGINYRLLHTMPHLHGVTTSVLIYQKLFILGLNSGSVVIFYLESPSDVMTLQLNSPHLWVVLGKEPITSLAVSAARTSTMLLAASTRAMHLVRIV